MSPLEQSRAWMDTLTAEELASIIGCNVGVAEGYKTGKPTLPLKSFDTLSLEMAKREPPKTEQDFVAENAALKEENGEFARGVLALRDTLQEKDKRIAELMETNTDLAAKPFHPDPSTQMVGILARTAEAMRPPAQAEEAFDTDPIPEGVRIALLTPTRGGVTDETRHCIESTVRRFPQKVLPFHSAPSFNLCWERNRLTKRWFDADIPWALWLDSDTVIPIAEPEWFKSKVPDSRTWGKQFLEIHALDRLLFSAIGSGTSDKPERTIMGAVYFDRTGKGVPMVQRFKDNDMLAARLNSQGPRVEVADAGTWAGTGCLLVHRSVIADIIAKLPETAVVNLESKPHLGYSHDFFSSINDTSDDVSFCDRAIRAGHKIYVDLSVFCGHMGGYGFSNKKLIP